MDVFELPELPHRHVDPHISRGGKRTFGVTWASHKVEDQYEAHKEYKVRDVRSDHGLDFFED